MEINQNQRFFGREITNVVNYRPNKGLNASKVNQKDKYKKSYQKISDQQKYPLLQISQYIKDIYQRAFEKQIENKCIGNYLKKYRLITTNKRIQIIDRIICIHQKNRLFPQTLFMSVWLFDRCLSTGKYQNERIIDLLGITCLMLSTKYQQTYKSLKIKQLIEKQQYNYIIAMQGQIAQILNFDFVNYSALLFFQYLAKQTKMSIKNFCLGKYILELSLLEINYLQYSQSMLGCSVFYLVNRLKNIDSLWPYIISQLTSYSQKDLQRCSQKLLQTYQNSYFDIKYITIKNKYASRQYEEVSLLKMENKRNFFQFNY